MYLDLMLLLVILVLLVQVLAIVTDQHARDREQPHAGSSIPVYQMVKQVVDAWADMRELQAPFYQVPEEALEQQRKAVINTHT